MYLYYVSTFLIFALTNVYAAPVDLPKPISIYASLSSIKRNCSYTEDLKLFDTKLEFLEPCKNISLTLPLDKLEVDNIHQPLCLIYYNSFQQLCSKSDRLSKNELIHNTAVSKISSYKSNVSHVCEILEGSFNSTLALRGNFTHDAIPQPAVSTISKFFKNKKCARLCTDLDDSVFLICVYAAIMTEESKVISQSTVNNNELVSKKMYSSSLKTNNAPIVKAQTLQGNHNSSMLTSTPKNESRDYKSLQNLGNIIKIHEVPLSGSNRDATSIDILTNNQSEVSETLPGHKADKSQPEMLARPPDNIKNIEVVTVITSELPGKISVGTSKKEPSTISTDGLNKAQKQPVENQQQPDLIDKAHELISSSSSSTEIPQAEPTNMKTQRNEPDDMYSDLEEEAKLQTKSKPSETVEDSRNFSANYQNQNIDDSNSYFFSYFMMACIVFIFAYVAYHNKQKILALVVEGRKGRRPSRTRRPNSANYRKLDTNLEEAVTSSCSKNATTHVIY